ncbi:trypsin-like serine protease [Pseudoxanthomonas sp. UC29_72]
MAAGSATCSIRHRQRCRSRAARGSGDSGGPVLLQAGNDWRLAGLTSWSDPQSGIRTPGRYGQITCNVRLSHCQDWIKSVTAGAAQAGPRPGAA